MISVAVVFGGTSAEHDVSLMSVRRVLKFLDRKKYELLPIYISREGEWFEAEVQDAEPALSFLNLARRVLLVPGNVGEVAYVDRNASNALQIQRVDAIFPVLHGPGGEDGSVQSIASLCGIPCVGSGILASALAMDKDFAKKILSGAGLRVANSATFHLGDAIPSFSELRKTLGHEMFVKPARLGSSVGVSKVRGESELRQAIELAYSHDKKILIEESVSGREIECGVLVKADKTVYVTRPGEIIPSNRFSFYNYEAKYLDENGAEIRFPAEIDTSTETQIMSLTEQAFRALGCEGMVRVDFFLKESGELIINELNTIPGLTGKSMFPLLFGGSGISDRDLFEFLVDGAISAHRELHR